MSAQHTPGPWVARGAVDIGIEIFDASMFPICSLRCIPNAEMMAADALLIAAAPDLLAALEHIVELCDDADADEMTQAAARIAHEAINKAKGTP
jgi:hypothetical protein